MAPKFAAVVFTLGCMHAGVVSALGLGEMTLESFLNEPLRAELDLLNTGTLSEHQIKVRLATSDDFERMGIDRAYFLTGIKFEVVVDENGHGKIVLTSEDPVLEPYLDLIVETRWPSGRMLREYTLLIDPPVFDQSAPIVSARELAAESDGSASSAKKKPEVAAHTGTKVSTFKSDLPPGSMPERDFGSQAESTPGAGHRYMIRRDETLWAIAQNSRPAGVSVQQTMLDIQRLNPDAFIDNNINRIKAGYIIYLPSSSEISSDDESSAVAEVRQQNQDWRDGVASQPRESAGPSLRIMAEPDEDAVEDTGGALGQDSAASGSSADGMDADSESRQRSQGRAVMSERVETLEQMVALKDDKIAALERALAEARSASAATVDDDYAMDQSTAEDASVTEDSSSELTEMSAEDAEQMLVAQIEADAGIGGDMASGPGDDGSGDAGLIDSEAAETEAEASQEAAVTEEPVAAAPASPKPAPPVQESGGIMGSLSYIIGLLVVAVLAAVYFMRRRAKQREEEAADQDDVFAGVQLAEQELDVDDIDELDDETETASEDAEPAMAAESVETEEPEPEFQGDERRSKPREGDNRGYGEGKHDQYADDMDAADALAEADIYIAYGRFPQAVDLLKTAIDSDPMNSAYREKLITLSVEMGTHRETQQQYADLLVINNSASIARAEQVIGNSKLMENLPEATIEPLPSVDSGSGEAELEPADLSELVEDEALDLGGDQDLAELGMDQELADLEDIGDLGSDLASLESFGDLELDTATTDADLDLSSDLESDDTALVEDEGEPAFTDDGGEMSTKLDLARAYQDMGDGDGARQILQEVAVSGNEDQKREASELLEALE